jgi:hypothetical protein
MAPFWNVRIFIGFVWSFICAHYILHLCPHFLNFLTMNMNRPFDLQSPCWCVNVLVGSLPKNYASTIRSASSRRKKNLGTWFNPPDHLQTQASATLFPDHQPPFSYIICILWSSLEQEQLKPHEPLDHKSIAILERQKKAARESILARGMRKVIRYRHYLPKKEVLNQRLRWSQCYNTSSGMWAPTQGVPSLERARDASKAPKGTKKRGGCLVS